MRARFRFDDKAMWLDDLRPAFGQEKFFYEDEFAALSMVSADSRISSGQVHSLQGPSPAQAEIAGVNGGEGREVFGQGMCVTGGVGDLRYRNGVIPPAPVGGRSSSAIHARGI